VSRLIKASFASLLTFLIALPSMAQDMPTPAFPHKWQLGLQPAATPVMEMMVAFHTELLWIITAISLFVLLLLIIVAVRFNEKANPVPAKWSHNTLIEVIWTAVPVLILVAIAIPSYKLLYFQDRVEQADMTLKIIGNQWYWTYEYPDSEISFDAQHVDDKDIKPGQHRLLETDNHVVLPVDTNIRLLFTATDVIHAWTIPAFGVKLDNVPGRTNETWTRITVPGRYYGQCSELCGVDHSFMPIVVDAVSKDEFQKWVTAQKPAPKTADASAN
jgi:cytochrome c oxidase subunit 2